MTTPEHPAPDLRQAAVQAREAIEQALSYELGAKAKDAAWNALASLDVALSAPPAQEQAGQMVSDERALRRLLCSVYAGPLAYMDDGEAQDNRAHPFIDFLRDAPDVIAAKMRERAASPVQQELTCPRR
jgi:hypothetical protein